ncbi:hypothetical protein M422DRAFT_777013 [Sphaerobolus stellatus SS14]|nr:hypothetical protein M422DRAFT_777013 [Sphaerobolus stellatus SS14]
MQDTGLDEIVRRARYILSILPPSTTVAFSQDIRDRLSKTTSSEVAGNVDDQGFGDRPSGTRLVFVDCNAVSPATVQQIVGYFTEDTFVDAGIIGGSPSAPGATNVYDPTFYASGKADIVGKFAEVLTRGGLKVTALPAKAGEASVLKMGYAGISKGLTGLTAAMVLATHASFPATSAALMQELSFSQPYLLQRSTCSIPDMLPKAYCFEGEMEEIAGFISASGLGGASDIWMGLARLYESVAKSLKEDGDEHKVLQEFVEQSKETLAQKVTSGSEEKGIFSK